MVAAIKPYYVRLWTFDPFPDDKLQTQWVNDSWDEVSGGVPVPDTKVLRYVGDIFVRQRAPVS